MHMHNVDWAPMNARGNRMFRVSADLEITRLGLLGLVFTHEPGDRSVPPPTCLVSKEQLVKRLRSLIVVN